MNQIPKLDLQSRKLVSTGADFIVYRLSLKAPKLKPGAADRLETWKRVSKNKLRLFTEDYLIETDSHGNKRTVFYWQSNYRLATVGNSVYELQSSKPIELWR